MFELHYEYICAAGWKDEKVKTIDHYDDLDGVLEECKRNGYKVLDNPMCLDCKRFPDTCAGTRNHIWNGCTYRIRKEKENDKK